MDEFVRRRPALRGAEVTFNILNIQIGNMPVETSNNPLHALIAFIFFVLLGFIQIKFPDNPTAFRVHPKTMSVSIASFIVYCLAFWGRLTNKIAIIQVHHFDTLMQVFGSLSLISMALMLLPDTWGESLGLIMYILWFICHVLVLIRTRFNFIGIWQQVRRRREPPLLPTTSLDLNNYMIQASSSPL